MYSVDKSIKIEKLVSMGCMGCLIGVLFHALIFILSMDGKDL